MREHYLKKLTLSAASVVVTLIALEIALRLFGYSPYTDWRQKDFSVRPSVNAELKYELTPGATGHHGNAEIKINSQGFRGPEPSSNPAHRVIILGDSIAFGNNLPWEDTFSYQLQHNLDSQNRNIEILDLGVTGYDTLQEVALFETRGLQFQPNLVVVTYCLNDISIASVNWDALRQTKSQRFSFLYESRLAQLIAHSVQTIRTKYWLKRRNDPAVFHHDYENQIDPISDDESELLGLMGQSPKWPSTTWYGERDRVGRLRFGFRRLASMSKANGFPVVIMIVPLLFDNEGAYSHQAAHRIVEMEAHRAGFDTIDLTNDFKRAGMRSLRLLPGDILHPNKAGHTIMADSLSAFIANHEQW